VTVTLTHPKTYTEAAHTVHAAELHGAAPLYSTGSAGLIKPDAVTVEYDWRTQLGHTGWQLAGIKLLGAWVTPDGAPNPEMAIAPRTTLLLNADNAPAWAVSFARFRFPRFLALQLPGEAVQPDAEPPLYDGEVPLSSITASTEIRHTVYGIEVSGAEPLRVPSDTPGVRDRWMRPAEVGVVYRLPMHADRGELVDQLGTVPTALGEWHLRDLSVTGPWVTETGRPVPHAVGMARWPGGERPGWLAELIARHTPDATTVPLRLA
jgi:hypothetical protein